VQSLNSLVQGGKVVDNIVPGDYTSLLLAAHMDDIAFGQLQDLLDILGLRTLGDVVGTPGDKDPKPQARHRRQGGGLGDLLQPLSLSGLLGGLL
jgi:hypothetical protein